MRQSASFLFFSWIKSIFSTLEKCWKQLLLFSLFFLEEIIEQGLQHFSGFLSFLLLQMSGTSYQLLLMLVEVNWKQIG